MVWQRWKSLFLNAGKNGIKKINSTNSVTHAAVVHLNFRAGLSFPVPVCTVPHWNWVNKADHQQD